MLYTIGYQGRTLDELLALLHAHDIDRLIDIRELPLSRRRGFSKTSLGDALRGDGIEYIHARIAGNPYRTEKDLIPRPELLAKYRAHLNASRGIAAEVATLARDHTVALLCYEAAAAECHRSILAPRVARRLGVKVADL